MAEFQTGEGADRLPQGSATQIAELQEATELPASPLADIEPEEDFEEDLDEEPEEQFQPQDEAEAFLFSHTQRPGEPVPSGAPFGPGPGFITSVTETEGLFRDRVAQFLETSPGATPQVQALAKRLRSGL